MDLRQFRQIQTRRDFFKWCAGGIGKNYPRGDPLELEGCAGTALLACESL